MRLQAAGLRSPRVCRARRNVRGWQRRHTANSAWAGKHGVRQRGACCCGALQCATCSSASVCYKQPITKHTHVAQDSSAPLRLHLHSPHAAPRHALHHPASETPSRPVTHQRIARRGGKPPACRRRAAQHGARWYTRRTAIAQAVEGRRRLLQEALWTSWRPSPRKEPRCSSPELQRARDLHQRYLLIGQQRDVGERHGDAGEVISE